MKSSHKKFTMKYSQTVFTIQKYQVGISWINLNNEGIWNLTFTWQYLKKRRRKEWDRDREKIRQNVKSCDYLFCCSENKRPTGRAAAAHARVQSGVCGARRQAHTEPRRGLSALTRARVSSQRSAESLTAPGKRQLEAADLAGRRSLRRRPLPSPTNAPPPATLPALRPRQLPRRALPAPSSPAQGRSPRGRAPPWLQRGAGRPEGSTAAAAEQEVSVGEKELLSGGRGTSGLAEARRPNWSGT